MTGTLNEPLASVDAEVARAIDHELGRQQSTLEMIASENYAPAAVMAAQGSVLTNKYAEGYPGKRYYGGCEHVDVIEQLAIDRVKQLFGAEHANVQPHSGAQANPPHVRAAQARRHHHGPRASRTAATSPTACASTSPASATTSSATASTRTTTVDMADVGAPGPRAQAEADHRRRLGLPAALDFARFRRIAEAVGAYFMVDMAHFAGLVAAGCTRTRCRMPTSSPPPRTRPSAARAAASS